MINFSKTNYMIFKPRNRIIDENLININIYNNEINRVTNFKFLGIKIDNKLTWKDHVNEMSQKISSVIGIMNGLKFILPIPIQFI